MSKFPAEIAPGIACLSVAIVNVYFVGAPGGPWVLVDTGLPGFLPYIKAAAAARYGPHSRPEAIILTHGHFDHAGNVHLLAEEWDVPVYCHPMEMPYLTGQSDYPPLDPTVGGFVPFLSRAFPSRGIDIRPRLRSLPDNGSVPGADGWLWHFTPGHAPGQVSLFREQGRVLIAGDALATVDMDSFLDTVTKKREMTRPPTFGTCDWDAARRSVEALASLAPELVAAGHGMPMAGPNVAGQIRALSAGFEPPAHGRYIPVPARTDSHGVVSVPPPAPDPVGIGLMVGGALLGTGLIWRHGQRKK